MWYAVSRTTWGFLIAAGWVTFVVSLGLPSARWATYILGVRVDSELLGWECAFNYSPMWTPNLVMFGSPWLAISCRRWAWGRELAFFLAMVLLIAVIATRLDWLSMKPDDGTQSIFFEPAVVELYIGYHIWTVAILVVTTAYLSLALRPRRASPKVSPFDEALGAPRTL